MTFIPLKQKGLEKHLKELGVSYSRVCTYFENEAPNRKIGQKLGRDEHTIARWKKQWANEMKQNRDNLALDTLSNV